MGDYLHGLLQTGGEFCNDHALLLPSRNIGFAFLQIDRSTLNQFGNPLPVDLIPGLLVGSPQPWGRADKVLAQFLPLLIIHRFPVQIQTLDEGASLPAIILLEAELKEHGFGTNESPAEILGGRKGEAQNEMGVVVFLPLILQSLVGWTRSRRRVRRQRKELLQERGNMRLSLCRRLVAVRAGFNFRQNCKAVRAANRRD